MSEAREKSLERQIRAFHWVRLLSEIPRQPGGAAGAEAAHRIEAWLREIGIEDIERRPLPARTSAALSVACHLALGALACVLGGWFGSALALTAAGSFRRESRGRPLLSRWLPARSSQNVIARVGAEAPSQRVVLSARIDTAPTRGWWETAASWLVERTGALYPSRRPAVDGVPETLLWLGAAVVLVGWLGGASGLVGGATLLIGACLALGSISALIWDRLGGDSSRQLLASGAASMLTAGEQLLAQLPQGVELWIVGCGGERFGAQGLRSFIEAHPEWPTDSSYFVHFEPVGGGSLHYGCGAGPNGWGQGAPTLLELARRVSESGVFGELTRCDRVGSTEGEIATAAGFPALFLASLDADRRPAMDAGTPDVDMPTVIRAADFGAAVARAALRGEAGPIAIL